MNSQEILSTAITTIRDRGPVYGDFRENFARAAAIASNRLGKTITAYDVAVIMASMKQSRLSHDKTNTDSWVDLVAYEAFAASLATSAPTSVDLVNIEKGIQEAISNVTA